MAGRGSFQAIAPNDVARLMALEGGERWDFAAGEVAARSVVRMDKWWAPIHSALLDGRINGALGDPPLWNAVLGDHLVYESRWGDFIYLKHPSEVAEIADELSVLGLDEFAERWEAVDPGPDSDALGLSHTQAEAEFVWPLLEEMQAFYRQAAAEGSAVLFCWG